MKSRWRQRLLAGCSSGWRWSLGAAMVLLPTNRRLPAQSRIFGPRECGERKMYGARPRGPLAFGARGVTLDQRGNALTDLDQFFGREIGLEAVEGARFLPLAGLLRLSRQILRKDSLLDRDPLPTP